MASSGASDGASTPMMINGSSGDSQDVPEKKLGPWTPGITPNLVKEFEASYGSLLEVLTLDERINSIDAEMMKKGEEKMKEFLDVARKLETFFLRSKQLIHVHKPDNALKEEIMEMRQEIQRKDELIARHFEKVTRWQSLVQQAEISASNPGAPPPAMPINNTAPSGAGFSNMNPRMPMHSNMYPSGPAGPRPMMPNNNFRNMNPSSAGNQDPLSYLERTTSNVGTPPGPVSR